MAVCPCTSGEVGQTIRYRDLPVYPQQLTFSDLAIEKATGREEDGVARLGEAHTNVVQPATVGGVIVAASSTMRSVAIADRIDSRSKTSPRKLADVVYAPGSLVVADVCRYQLAA